MTLRKKFAALVSSLLAAVLLLTGCGAPIHEEGTAVSETGILTLSVNPEIQIEYNKEGKVTALAGKNDDGEAIVAAYPDYIGKECGDVLKGLIVEINEAGYFVEDIAFPFCIINSLVHFFFRCRNVLGEFHALFEEGEHLVVYIVNFNAYFI